MNMTIGKAKAKPFLFLVFMVCKLGATQAIGALPALEFGMGFAYARTKVESAATGYHHGWNVSADANWLFRISLEDENLIKAKAEKETSSRVNMIFSPGLHAQFITMSASNWLPDGSRYRAWDSIGIGPELNLGLEFTNSMTMHKNGFLFSMAYLASFSNYTQTTLYSAYNSWVLKVSWNTRIDHNTAFFAALPLEYAFRADGKSILSGLVMGIRYEF